MQAAHGRYRRGRRPAAEGGCAGAIELSKGIDTPRHQAFGAVVAKGGKIVGEGLNQSLEHFDPTSHGEVEAIRDACRRLETLTLARRCKRPPSHARFAFSPWC
jgi:tRNA(Arg) A34 adenosine deaminase TadA